MLKMMVLNPIPSTLVVACEDDPSYSVDVWHDCHQEDDAVSGPDDDVTASSSSAPSYSQKLVLTPSNEFRMQVAILCDCYGMMPVIGCQLAGPSIA